MLKAEAYTAATLKDKVLKESDTKICCILITMAMSKAYKYSCGAQAKVFPITLVKRHESKAPHLTTINNTDIPTHSPRNIRHKYNSHSNQQVLESKIQVFAKVFSSSTFALQMRLNIITRSIINHGQHLCFFLLCFFLTMVQ